MRTRLLVCSVSVLLAMGCSVVTSWDGIALDGVDASAIDSGALDAHGEASADAGADSGPALCTPGGYYCGGDRNPFNPQNLYQCSSDGGAFTLARTCMHGCRVRNDADDVCVCSDGGAYCGSDQVIGDPSWLYRCAPDETPVLLQKCARGCQVNAGADDTCF